MSADLTTTNGVVEMMYVGKQPWQWTGKHWGGTPDPDG